MHVTAPVHPCCRWALWLARLEADLAQGRRYDPEAWRMQSLNFTQEWAARTHEVMPTEPAGDAVAVSRHLYEKYVQPAPAAAEPLEMVQAMDVILL
jgi:hypothetical protein